MELGPANQRFKTHSPSFDDLSRVKTFTGKQNMEIALINVPVKPSFIPNRKILFGTLATITAVAIVSSAVAVIVLFLGSGGKEADSGHQSDRYTSLSNSQATSAPGTAQSSTRIATGSTLAPIVGVWLEWGSWTICAVTCGLGIQTRYRSCENATIGSNCHGNYVQLQQCHGGHCPVYGKWTTWSSWNGCTASCSGGIQSRTRFCQKNITSDLDCVGAEAQSQSCNSFICQDCSQICSDGSLSSDCSRCECSVTLTGRVLNKARSFVEGAVIRESSTPYVILAETDSLGRFTLNSTCVGKELLVTRTDYQDNFTVVTNQDTEIIMENIVLPHFTMNPTSKNRLSSESVTFCCHADGKPEIKYYEWFKDGILLDSSQYSNGTHLQLTNLAFKDSGKYVCRANSNAGSRYSAVATLSVRDKSNDFCADAYQQEWQSLPDDCVQTDGTTQYEVGTCMSKKCRSDNSSASLSCGEAETSCCGVSAFDVVNVNCDSYNLSLFVVKGCTCQPCRSTSVRLEGVAKSLESDLPLKYGQIWLNGILVTRTGLNGQFSITVDKNIREATLTAKDDIFNLFLESTKSISIPEDPRDTFYITMYMVRKNSYVVEVSTYVENTIYCGQNPNDPSSAVASLVIPPDTLYYSNGTQYNGVVTASLTYFDTRNETALQSAPGRFEFVDEEGEVQLLETLGVFNLLIQDARGSPITVQGGIDIYLNNDIYSTDPAGAEGLKIWGLSPSTGRWETIMSNEDLRQRLKTNSEIITNKAISRRTRRQTGFWVGQVGFSFIYFNLDVFTYYEICYFKVRIFRTSTFNTVNEIRNRYLKLSAPIFTRRAFVLYQTEFINNPGSECFKTRCGYDGYIEITQNDRVLSKEVALIPADPKINNSHGIDSDSTSKINYTVSKSGRALAATFLSSINGPFFQDKAQCENSGFDQNHFRFFEEYQDPNIYTFKKNFDPLSDIKDGIDHSLLQQTIRKVWYPQFEDDKYIACAMKISLSYKGNEKYKIRVRVISFVGTNARAKGEIYGIREVEIDNSGTACLEYKCSADLDIYLEQKESDTTRVKIIPIVGNTISCTVNVDNLHHQTGQKEYENNVPRVFIGDKGLYVDFTDSVRLNEIGPGALKKCSSGTSSAVSFICR